jgi:SAM-dependent methyltransferase
MSTGTSYELPFADNTFDVVHAHQVLQHLTDPVLALKEMKRVTKEGGTVSCREADYATMLAFPESPGIDFWRDMYHRVAWHNGAFPDAGRMVKSWALEAGYEYVCLLACHIVLLSIAISNRSSINSKLFFTIRLIDATSLETVPDCHQSIKHAPGSKSTAFVQRPLDIAHEPRRRTNPPRCPPS